MPLTYYANELDPKYQSMGSKLSQLVQNPFYGIVNDGIFSSPTVSQAQLLRPFPQFTDLTDAQNIGSDTWYNALQTTVKKRLGSRRCNSKPRTCGRNRSTAAKATPQNHYRMDVERSVSSRDTPHRFVASYLYETAFRQGPLLPPPVAGAWSSRMVGGWQFNGITTIQSGTALSITASNTAGTFGATEYANNNGTSGALSGRAAGPAEPLVRHLGLQPAGSLHLRQSLAARRRHPRSLHQQLRPVALQGISSGGRVDEDAVPCRSAECLQSRAVRHAEHVGDLEFVRPRYRAGQHAAASAVRAQAVVVRKPVQTAHTAPRTPFTFRRNANVEEAIYRTGSSG